MNKTLTILSIFLLAVMSLASATMDLSVDSIEITPAQPIEGQDITIDVTITNVGDVNFSASTNALTLDYDDTTTEDMDTPEITIGASEVLTFTHAYSAATDYTLTATYNAGDDNATNDEATLAITVDELNVAPTIDAISNIVVIVGETHSHTAVANDANVNDDIVFSLTGPLGMVIDDTTGVITWTPMTIVPATTVTVVVSDGTLSASTTFTASSKIDRAEISFIAEEILLGGSNYERGDATSSTIIIENTGTKTITNLDVVLTDTRNNPLDIEYTPFFDVSKYTLAPGETAIATVSITIPEDADSEERQIGELTATGLSGTTIVEDEVDVNLEAESFIEITDIDIELNGDDEGSLDDNDNFDDALEGDKVRLTITLDNLYSDSDDEIKDAYIEVTDDNWDIDETSDEKDIDGDDDTTFTIEFTIDDEVDDETNEFLIRAYGEDDRSGMASFDHFDEWEITFEINREDDDIRITDISFSRNPVDCTADTVTMDVTIRNYGEDNQDEIFIYAYSDASELDWNQKKTYIELDSYDETTRAFIIDLPRDVRENTYIIEVEVKYGISNDADEETVLLDIVCYGDLPDYDDEPSDDSSADNDDALVITTDDTNLGNTGGNIVPTGNIIYGQEKSDFESFTDSTTYLVLLALLVFVVLGIVIGWLGTTLRK